MKNKEEIKKEIRNYILQESLSDSNTIKDHTLIFDTGLLDSMGLLFLVEFLNDNFQIEVNDEELNPTNFESINSITTFLEKKLNYISNVVSK